MFTMTGQLTRLTVYEFLILLHYHGILNRVPDEHMLHMAYTQQCTGVVLFEILQTCLWYQYVHQDYMYQPKVLTTTTLIW